MIESREVGLVRRPVGVPRTEDVDVVDRELDEPAFPIDEGGESR